MESGYILASGFTWIIFFLVDGHSVGGATVCRYRREDRYAAEQCVETVHQIRLY